MGGHPDPVRTGELPVGVRLHLAPQPSMPKLLPALGPHSPWSGNVLPLHAAETPSAARRIPGRARRPAQTSATAAPEHKENGEKGIRALTEGVSAVWKTK